MQTFYKVCLILMIIGGINWGLVGLFQFDFVGWLLGGSSSIWSRIAMACAAPTPASKKAQTQLGHGWVTSQASGASTPSI